MFSAATPKAMKMVDRLEKIPSLYRSIDDVVQQILTVWHRTMS
jgi:hypothetical protein